MLGSTWNRGGRGDPDGCAYHVVKIPKGEASCPLKVPARVVLIVRVSRDGEGSWKLISISKDWTKKQYVAVAVDTLE